MTIVNGVKLYWPYDNDPFNLDHPRAGRVVLLLSAKGLQVTPVLTKREKEIIVLLAAGKSRSAAARALGISHHTVNDHMRKMLARHDWNSVAQAIVACFRTGIIE